LTAASEASSHDLEVVVMPFRRSRQRTRDRIISAAMTEFSALGLSGARVDSIARRARINKRMLYHYFGKKKDLYRAEHPADRVPTGRAARDRHDPELARVPAAVGGLPAPLRRALEAASGARRRGGGES